MILYEFEGKKLLSGAGIPVPKSELITHHTSPIALKTPVILKAQVLSGKRADAGGIVKVEDDSELSSKLQALLNSTVNKEKVEKVLIEEVAEFDDEYYVSLSYDTETRGPLLTISLQGGTGIEERGVETYSVDPLEPNKILKQVQDDSTIDANLVEKLVNLFFNQDCLLLEINPLIKAKNNKWVALDTKVKLDDTAVGRHETWREYPPRSAPGHTSTKREIEAKKIDEVDYRGVAGSTYFDLDGDIAILASGGGASLTAMDSLISLGGKPANFTEYSGNPPREKVKKLTEIVLDKPNLNGLWVVGAVANFTDIYETLGGIVDALKEIKPKIPIVVRRAGPRDSEAFEMLKNEKDFDLHLFGEKTSIPQSAKVIVDLAKKYASFTR